MQSQTRKNCLHWYKSTDHTVANELLRRVSTLLKGLISLQFSHHQVSSISHQFLIIFSSFSHHFLIIFSSFGLISLQVSTLQCCICAFSPTLYPGKLARIWSCTAGFDVITYALVKKIIFFSIVVLT